MRVLGIDPGLNGGLAVIVTGDEPFRLWGAIDILTRGDDAKRRVDVLAVAHWIKAAAPNFAFIERAGVMPGQGIASGFIYGRAVGSLEAAAVLAHVPLQTVEPRMWKQHFDLRQASKEVSRQMVLRCVPGSAQYLKRKSDHGRAEAILIAMYGADLIAAELEDHGNGNESLCFARRVLRA